MKPLMFRIALIFVDVFVFINLCMVLGISFNINDFAIVNWGPDYMFSSSSFYSWLEDMPSTLNGEFFVQLGNEWIRLVAPALNSNSAWENFSLLIQNYATALIYPFIMIFKILVAAKDYIVWFAKLFAGFYNIPVYRGSHGTTLLDPTYLEPNWWEASLKILLSYIS